MLGLLVGLFFLGIAGFSLVMWCIGKLLIFIGETFEPKQCAQRSIPKNMTSMQRADYFLASREAENEEARRKVEWLNSAHGALKTEIERDNIKNGSEQEALENLNDMAQRVTYAQQEHAELLETDREALRLVKLFKEQNR